MEKAKKKHLQSFGNDCKCELVLDWNTKSDEENPGVTDGGARVAAMGVGHGIPSRQGRRGEAESWREGVPVPCAKV